jgi:hypothetical protein
MSKDSDDVPGWFVSLLAGVVSTFFWGIGALTMHDDASRQFCLSCHSACDRRSAGSEEAFIRDNYCYCDDGTRMHMDVGAMWSE